MGLSKELSLEQLQMQFESTAIDYMHLFDVFKAG